MASIKVWHGYELLAAADAPGEVSLLFEGTYQVGDELEFVSDVPDAVVQVDASVLPARVWLPQKRFRYRLPLAGDNLNVYAPGAFGGAKHLLWLKPAVGNEYRNLAENPADQRGETNAYPHAAANVETRNESCFCARNAIDGVHIANGHGSWPWGSWGIGAREDAILTLDFGREVRVDRLALYLRADFPHDAYWVQAAALFSDGSELTFPLKRMDGMQAVDFPAKTIRWVKLGRLIKSNDPSAFPALRQLEVWGKSANGASQGFDK